MVDFSLVSVLSRLVIVVVFVLWLLVIKRVFGVGVGCCSVWMIRLCEL